MQKITLTGRLGRDAAVRETQDGGKMISFTMAVNGISRGVEKTYWYDVLSFNYSRYKNMVKYLTKGSSVAVVGDLDADIEEGRDGEYRCRRNVMADSIEFNSSGTSGSTSSDSTEERPRRRRSEDAEAVSDDEVSTRTRRRRDEEEEEEPRTTRRSSRKAEEYEEEEEEPKPKRRPRVEEEEEDEEQPRTRRRAKSSDDDGEEEIPF